MYMCTRPLSSIYRVHQLLSSAILIRYGMFLSIAVVLPYSWKISWVKTFMNRRNYMDRISWRIMSSIAIRDWGLSLAT